MIFYSSGFMIKALALILTIAGIIGLILGVLGIFGKNVVALSPWALAILGLIFFSSGVGLLKQRRDTDEIR
jgi:hypothetical protein